MLISIEAMDEALAGLHKNNYALSKIGAGNNQDAHRLYDLITDDWLLSSWIAMTAILKAQLDLAEFREDPDPDLDENLPSNTEI